MIRSGIRRKELLADKDRISSELYGGRKLDFQLTRKKHLFVLLGSLTPMTQIVLSLYLMIEFFLERIVGMRTWIRLPYLMSLM